MMTDIYLIFFFGSKNIVSPDSACSPQSVGSRRFCNKVINLPLVRMLLHEADYIDCSLTILVLPKSFKRVLNRFQLAELLPHQRCRLLGGMRAAGRET